MANISTFGNLDRNPDNPSRNDNVPLFYTVFGRSPLAGSSEFWKSMFPSIDLGQAIVMISFFQFVVYGIAMSIDGVVPKNLSVSQDNLEFLGGAVTTKIREYEVWRLLTSIILSNSGYEVVTSILFQLRVGCPIEKRYGPIATTIVYFGVGVYTNLFCSVWRMCTPSSNDPFVGANDAFFGLIGLQMAEIILAWHLYPNIENAFSILIMLLLIIAFSGLYQFITTSVSITAGIAIGILLNYNLETRPRWYSFGRWASCLLLLISSTICGLYLWVSDECLFPHSQIYPFSLE